MKRTGSVRVWLSSLLVIFAAAITLFIFSDTTAETQKPDAPPGGTAESSEVEQKQLPAAPEAKPDKNGPQISSVETPEGQSDETRIANEVYSKVSESIVCITSYKAGKDYTLDAVGEGSGIILTEDGYIATNSHVVDDSKKTGVMVTLWNDEQYLGTIIGVDAKTDLAVIKIDAKGLNPAEFADSDTLQVGQQAFAIGNPGGSAFSNSMTKGAISALNRILSSGYVRYIQTDAAINPGNSGGALINEHAQVIGINTAKLAAVDFEGMGFAIPSNTVMEIINKLIRYGYVNDRGTLGIEVRTCTLYMSKANHVPQGMMITKFNSDSPLLQTDAKKDDIITAINDAPITSSAEMVDEIKKFKPDDEVTLSLYRPAKTKSETAYRFTVKVKLIPDTGSEEDDLS